MSQPLSLSPQEAQAKIQQISDARDHAVQKLRQIADEQHAMLSGPWTGGKATQYGNVSQQQNDDFDAIIKTLDDIVQKGSDHMNRISHHDA
jgi:uncharacterized protein YukE